MKHSTEFDKFDHLVGQVLSVSHEEIQKRETEYRKRADANPHKRGPKKKKRAIKQPASHA